MSDEPVNKLRCGGCGADRYTLAQVGIRQEVLEIHVTCCGCGSVSKIKPTPARVGFAWGDDSKRDTGLPAVF